MTENIIIQSLQLKNTTLKKFLNKYLPSHNKVKSSKVLQIFGSRINDSSLWTIHRRSVPKAAAIGVFCAYIPLPIEMLLAALFAWQFRAYMPLAVALVWISNPLTWFMLYTPPYWLGAFLMDIERISLHALDLSQFSNHFLALMLGCLIFGVFFGFGAYILARVLWRMIAINRMEKRRIRLAEFEALAEQLEREKSEQYYDELEEFKNNEK